MQILTRSLVTLGCFIDRYCSSSFEGKCWRLLTYFPACFSSFLQMVFDLLGTLFTEFTIYQKSFKKCLSNEKLTYCPFIEKFNNATLGSHIYRNVLVCQFWWICFNKFSTMQDIYGIFLEVVFNERSLCFW